jgi:pimeloyl-ACP methyl ester carboxylesterase
LQPDRYLVVVDGEVPLDDLQQLPLDDAFDYSRRLGAPLRTIADCGHLLIVERPAACLDAVESFLAAR